MTLLEGTERERTRFFALWLPCLFRQIQPRCLSVPAMLQGRLPPFANSQVWCLSSHQVVSYCKRVCVDFLVFFNWRQRERVKAVLHVSRKLLWVLWDLISLVTVAFFDIKAFYLPLTFSLVLIYVLLFFLFFFSFPIDHNWLHILQVTKSSLSSKACHFLS